MNNKNEIEKAHQSAFEAVRKVNQQGQDYWSARELSKILGYLEYRNFLPVIVKAEEACLNSGQKIEDHFVDIHEMVSIGSGASREMPTIALSRYACYLIVQNADPAKPIVALGQTYFAVQTRKQELIEQAGYQSLKTEEERRLFLRSQLKVHNKQLAGVAKNAGVIKTLDYAIFQDHGYKGPYGELASKDIHTRKQLKKGSRFWIIWAVQSLRPISFALRKQKRSSSVMASKTNIKPIRRIMMLVEKPERLSKKLVVQCLRIYRRWKA